MTNNKRPKTALSQIGGFVRHIRSLCKDKDVKVKECRGDDVSIDVKKGAVYLPTQKYYIEGKPLTSTELDKLHYQALDGVLRYNYIKEYTSVEQAAKLKDDSPLHMVYDKLEQARYLRTHARDYLGDKYVTESAYGNDLDKLSEDLKKGEITPQSDADNLFMAAAGLDILARSHWNAGAALHGGDVLKNMPKDVQKKIEDVLAKNPKLLDEINNCSTSKDNWDICKRVFDELSDDETAEEHCNNPDNQQGSKGGKGEGVSKSMSKGISSGAESTPQGGHAFDMDSQLGDDNATEDYSDPPAGGAGKMARYDFDSVLHHGKRSTSIANRIKRKLEIKRQAYYIGGQTKGPRFHAKSLYRACVPKVGNGTFNNRIRKKKFEAHLKDAAISILLDFSGSMGSDVQDAVEMGSIIAETMERLLQVPVEIIAFHGVPIVVKSFSRPYNPHKLIAACQRISLGGTSLGYAMLIATDRIERRKEHKKIIIAITDGATSDRDLLKNLTNELNAREDYELYGIAIGDILNVKHYFKNSSSVQDSGGLVEACLDAIDESFIKNSDK